MNRALWTIALFAALILSACQGLAGEPVVVATLPPQIEQLPLPEATVEAVAPQALEQSVAVAAATEEPEVLGTVTGQVVNGTAGAAVPANVTLRLHIVNPHGGGDSLEGVAGADGSYRFENVPLRADRQYFVAAQYNDAIFVSEMGLANLTTGEIALPVTIYEIGSDPAVIQIDRIMSQVNAANDLLQVIQIVSFINTSDRVFVSGEGEAARSVSVRLPQGAWYENVMGGNYVVSEDGTQVFETAPLMPGEPHLMHVAFTLPYTGNSSIEQTLDYPLKGKFELLLGNEGLQASGDGLTNLGALQFQGGVFPSYGYDLDQAAGQAVRYTVSGTPVSPRAPSSPQPNPLPLVLIAAGVVAIVAALVLYLRERAAQRKLATIPGGAEVSALMKQIAELDVQHRDGKMSDADYQRRRADLKTRLTETMKTAARH